MELRVLTYFLAVAREESFSGAAEALHLSQPTLSRQIMELEEELGCRLLIRGSRRVTLTEDGMRLRKRAEDILELVHKTEREMALAGTELTGEVHIGAGETQGTRWLFRAARELRRDHPGVNFHITSGDADYVVEQLDRGLIDFGLVFDHVDVSRYNTLLLPTRDRWGLMLRQDHPLAARTGIRPEELWELPLLLPRGAMRNHFLDDWLQGDGDGLHIASTYSLVYNASLMVEEGFGCAVTLDGIIRMTEDSPLCFVPLDPPLQAEMHVIWKKYQVLPKAAERYLARLRELCAEAE